MSDHRPTLYLCLLLTLAAASCHGADDSAGGSAGSSTEGDQPYAAVLLYHHVSVDTPASTSVTPETFEAHLDYLSEAGYHVVALSRVVEALSAGDTLPPQAVAITFDDAYASVFTEAAPRLRRRNLPFAVFVTTGYVDSQAGTYMSWEQLRELEAQGAEMANHSRRHDHYPQRPAGESESEWRERIRADIQGAQQRLEAELERPLKVIAYPYGEFDEALEALTQDLGFVGFGQQSGPAGPDSGLQNLPRFPMASRYADLDGLAEKLRTRPFAVEVLSETPRVLDPDAGAPTLRLRLAAEGARLDALSCFVGGETIQRVEWIDAAAGVVEVTARDALPVGRSKYTCTAPARDGAGVYYWYSHLWMKPPARGEWYAD